MNAFFLLPTDLTFCEIWKGEIKHGLVLESTGLETCSVRGTEFFVAGGLSMNLP
jgi:hypothetical protein